MRTGAPTLEHWERAEIVRSANEAGHTPAERLRADPANLARYARPPAVTPYPLEYAYHLLGDVRGRLVVDLGCGSGENTLLLALAGAQVYATDISHDLLSLCRRRLEINGIRSGVAYVACSAHQLALPDASADAVLGIAVLHHLDLQRAATEVHRVLKPRGRAIFQEPVRTSPFLKAVRRLVPYRAPDVSPFERPLTEAEVTGFARLFDGCRIRAFCLPFVGLAQVLPFARGRIHAFYRADARMLARWPALGYYAAVRVFEVTKGAT